MKNITKSVKTFAVLSVGMIVTTSAVAQVTTIATGLDNNSNGLSNKDYAVDYNYIQNRFDVVYYKKGQTNLDQNLFKKTGLTPTSLGSEVGPIYGNSTANQFADPGYFTNVDIEQGVCVIEGLLYADHLGFLDTINSFKKLSNNVTYYSGQYTPDCLYYQNFDPSSLSRNPLNPTEQFISGRWLDTSGADSTIYAWRIPVNSTSLLNTNFCNTSCYDVVPDRTLPIVSGELIYSVVTRTREVTISNQGQSLKLKLSDYPAEITVTTNPRYYPGIGRSFFLYSTADQFFIAYVETNSNIDQLFVKSCQNGSTTLQTILATPLNPSADSYGYYQVWLTSTENSRDTIQNPIVSWRSHNEKIWTNVKGEYVSYGLGNNPSVEVIPIAGTERKTYSVFFRDGSTLKTAPITIPR